MPKCAHTAEPPRCSAGAAPVRVAGSARRTSSIDVFWPNGRAGNMLMVGRARDVVTLRSAAAPIICREDSFEAALRPDRTIVTIEATPARPALSGLVGERGGGGLRKVLETLVPEERRDSTPLYLLLDDISGTSLVAGWAWSHWDPNWLANGLAAMKGFDVKSAFRDRAGICSGFAPGSSAFDPSTDRTGTTTSDLRNPDDPEGWHSFPVREGVGLRRARRLDVWLDDVIIVDSAFQDSASTPSGTRSVVHEYRLHLTADPATLRVLSVNAEPRVLPFVECTAAPANLGRLVGTPLPELRSRVLAELRGTAGCTHLNDALRALAEVPALVYRVHEPGRLDS
jgi:hypothetical protein